jgi:hypothetical protein
LHLLTCKRSANQAHLLAPLICGQPEERHVIIETACNQLFRVTDDPDPRLGHVWHGIPVKRGKGGFVDKADARPRLVRKASSRVVEA